MIKKLLLLNCALLFARLTCYAPKVLTGKLQNDMGNPWPSLSFLLRGTSIGTLSNANGKYSLSFTKPSIDQLVLVSSFIAAEQQEPVGVQRHPFVLKKN